MSEHTDVNNQPCCANIRNKYEIVLTETIIGPVGINAEGLRRRYAGTPTPMYVQQHSDAILENSHDAITGLHRAMKKNYTQKGQVSHDKSTSGAKTTIK